VLKGAVDKQHLAELNAVLDEMPLDTMQPGDWWGRVHGHTYGSPGHWQDGLNLQQIYEAGEPFERLLDHPSWVGKVRHFLGGEGTFDYAQGELFIDENFASIRVSPQAAILRHFAPFCWEFLRPVLTSRLCFQGPGEAIGVHSGNGPGNSMRNQSYFRNKRFYNGQLDMLLALTDIGPGDGGTMLIPASHKANFSHPFVAVSFQTPDCLIIDPKFTNQPLLVISGSILTDCSCPQDSKLALDDMPEAIEVFMEAGDVSTNQAGAIRCLGVLSVAFF